MKYYLSNNSKYGWHMERWLHEISGYNFKVVHRPAKELVLEDVLGRICEFQLDPALRDDEPTTADSGCDNSDQEVVRSVVYALKEIEGSTYRRRELKREQRRDRYLRDACGMLVGARVELTFGEGLDPGDTETFEAEVLRFCDCPRLSERHLSVKYDDGVCGCESYHRCTQKVLSRLGDATKTSAEESAIEGSRGDQESREIMVHAATPKTKESREQPQDDKLGAAIVSGTGPDADHSQLAEGGGVKGKQLQFEQQGA